MSETLAPGVDIEAIRASFPAIGRSEDVFFDNAGGSQVPACVADAIRDYMLTTYVQLGADYATSRACSGVVSRGHDFVKTFVNGDGIGEVALGPSTSALCAMLADCYARALDPERNEIVVCECGHESNVGAWVRLKERGYEVRFWRMDAEGGVGCPLDGLTPLLSEKTRLVCFPHVSNILGHIEDAKAIVDAAHGVGARAVVDGVAYAPHRAVDVKALGADWYVYSTYKVYGPHMGALFGTHEAFAELEGPNHVFVAKDAVPYKFELGGVSHEGCAGLCALGDYLGVLSGREGACDRSTVERAMEVMAALELPLQRRFIDWLASRHDVGVVGPLATGATRVATISFTHTGGKSSRDIALACNERGLGVRYGAFYANRLCMALGLEASDGVVRVSMAHYNTMDEVERLIGVLDGVL